jgi:RNA polymerase sigma factor (sigma-70 family)
MAINRLLPRGEVTVMPASNPFADDVATDAEDGELVLRAQDGDRDALEQLIGRHQAWIYNIVRRMLYWPQDSEDTTQEILIKVITKLSTFERRSSFRTWLYRLVINHVLNLRRRKAEEWNFERYKLVLEGMPDKDLADPNAIPPDIQLLVEEAKIGCTTGVLLCLTREQRLIYVLSEIFGATDAVGAELFDMTRENFRQKLSRARRDLHAFLNGQCGLVNSANPCRCAKKTDAFIQIGFVNPQNLLFARERVTRVRDVAGKTLGSLDAMQSAFGEVHRDHPFHDAPDFVAALRSLIDSAKFKSTLELE